MNKTYLTLQEKVMTKLICNYPTMDFQNMDTPALTNRQKTYND